MLASKYANESKDQEPQTPTRNKRQSVDGKPLPALPASPADRNNAAHRHNASASSIPPTSPLKDRTGLDASSPNGGPSSPAMRRVKNMSSERFDWSDDDPKSSFVPDSPVTASGLSPVRTAPRTSVPSTPSKRSSMNANAPVFNFSPKPSPTRESAPAPTPPAQLQSSPGHAAPTQTAPVQTAPVQEPPAVPPKQAPPVARPESRLAPPPANVPGLAPTPDIVSRLDTVTPTVRGVKKIMSGRGRPCIIRAPPSDAHNRPGWMPLTRAQAKARVDDFQRQGWDVSGFGHDMPTAGQDAGENHAQARQMWPDPSLFKDDKQPQEKPAVIFPDKKKWDDHMNFLIEEKLKGLGVVKAPTPPPESTLVEQPNPLSRAASSQYAGLSHSPPLPTSSAASQQMSWGMPFSPEFSQGASSTVNTSLGALASPALSMGNQQYGKQGKQNAPQNGFPFSYNPGHNYPMPQGWSPQLANSQGVARGGSPAFGFAGTQRVNSAFSNDTTDLFPGQQTPRAYENVPSPFAPSNGPSAKASRSNTLSQRPITPEQGREEDEDNQRTPGARQENSYPELAYPTPRGHTHRHNISANLEREVENPEYYPGEYVNEAGKLERRGGPPDFKFGGANTFAPGRSIGHQSVLSTASNTSQSRLNVNAKEFKFDPSASHGRQFSMSKNAFLPASQAQPQVSMVNVHGSKGGSTSSSTFNVSAPAFKPPEQSKFSFASLGFNFSGKKDQTEKKPEADKAEKADDKKDSPAAPKIFNHIETSDIVIPPKRSKAIAIVRPGESNTSSPKPAKNTDSDQEDESGRLGPGKDRAKRGRFSGGDGDEVPKFATPTPEPEPQPAPVVLGSNASAKDTFGPKNEPVAKPSEPLEKLVDVSDNDWHEPDLSTAWHEPEKKRDRLSPPKETAAEPEQVSGRSKKEPRPVRSAYVPPHKRQSLPYPDEQNKENEAATPTFDDIDDVMGALNDNNSDFGIEEGPKSRGRSPPKQAAVEPQKTATPSPLAPLNPNKLAQLGSQPALSPRGLSADWLRDQAERTSESPVRKISNVKDPQISDWDDILPASEDLPQAQFFDTRVKNLIEGVIRAQLGPLTSQLKDVRNSMTRISRDQQDFRAFSSHEKSSSDADDEDDVEAPPAHRTASRAASRKADRKMEHIRLAVADAVRNSQISGGSHEALEKEISLRHDAERRADDLKRAYDLSEQEIMLFKESAENQAHKIRGLEDTRKLSDDRVSELEQEIDELQSTLEEYRTSSKKWRGEIDNAKNAREALTATLEKMRLESESERALRTQTSQNLEQMQEALTEAASNLARERSVWQVRSEDQAKENAQLETKLEEALRVRTRQEEEIERLGLQEKLAIKSAIALEEQRNVNDKLEAELTKLRAEFMENQSHGSTFERDALDAQESAKTEVQRVRTLMEAEVEAANKRAENSRVDLEARIEILQAQLEGANAHSETTKQEHSRLLEESFAARKQALEDAHQTAMSKLTDQQTRFEQQLNDLSAQHEREIKNGIEDKERSESHLGNNLKLANDKITHYLDRIKHLEDKVQVAQSAAEAAAKAAGAQPAAAVIPVTAPEGPKPHTVTERVSPQALRESIVVLQEQLQERETQIERLEQELAEADKEAPTKLRAAETEIGWLREVLSVRVDDLTDLVNNLTMEKFDRGAARNAAIRIRANIQMEKQEKERVARGEPRTVPLPSLTDLQNFATPKAAQLAAAWGNWRKGGQSPMASMRGALAGPSHVDETPSKKPSPATGNHAPQDLSSAQSFLSGLMTPPASNVRRTPSTGPSTQRPLTTDPKLSYPFPRRGNDVSPTRGGDRDADQDEPPSTPRLLRQASYDEDAADTRSINYPTSDAEESPKKGLSMEEELADYENSVEDEDESTLVSLPRGETEDSPASPEEADKIAQTSGVEPLGDIVSSKAKPAVVPSLGKSRWSE